MRNQWVRGGLICGALLAGCGSTTFSKSGPPVPAREPRCDFQILTAAPAAGFVEIGTIDVNPGAYGSNSYRKIDSFKHEIQPYVCLAGGDAAIAYANGYGMYMKATILKASSGAARAAAGGDTTAGGETGCKYDTQCKGDRICVAGACADPPAAAARTAPAR